MKFILTGENKYLETIARIDNYFVNLDKPKNLDYGSDKNYIVLARKSFAQLCVALTAQGVQNPEGLTVFKFMEAVAFYENRQKNAPKEKAPPIRAKRKR